MDALKPCPFCGSIKLKFNNTWPKYEAMRYEMLKKYRPDCRLAKKYEKDHEDEQLSFDLD